MIPGMPEFEEMYVNTSQGDGDMRGPWNSDENFRFVSDPEQYTAVDGGDGSASVALGDLEARTAAAMAARGASAPTGNPLTGIELGKAEGTMARTVAVKQDAPAQDGSDKSPR